ncbi:MAG TPA: hypothetical protein VIU65_10800 [Pyrinomonadaceae bacterium]
MKRVTALLSLLLLALVLYPNPQVTSQNGVPKLRRIDLSGEWVNDRSEKITIQQTPGHVTGTFATGGGDCPLQGNNRKRPLYLSAVIKGRGLYEGGTLEGEMGGCTRVEKLIQDCNFDVAYIVRFKAEKISVNRISGMYTPDYVNYDEQKGKWVNCVNKKGEGTPVPFSLTRKCNPDSGALCETIGNAIRDVKAARAQTASTEFYQHLQMSLGDQLAKIRTNLCNNAAGEAKLGEIEDKLDSLSYQPGPANLQNNVTLGYIETDLRDLTRMVCGVGEPVTYPTCPEGMIKLTEAEAALLKQFEPTLINMLRTSASDIVGYDKTKTCLSKMFGSGCASSPFIENLKRVSQAHNEGLPVGDGCDMTCQSLGDWYEQEGCPDGLRKDTVIAKCKLACMALEWGQ